MTYLVHDEWICRSWRLSTKATPYVVNSQKHYASFECSIKKYKKTVEETR